MNVQEWKENRRKKKTLKSGLEVEIRLMSPGALREKGLAIPGIDAVTDDDTFGRALDLIKVILVSPAVGPGENEIDLADLSVEDINEIVGLHSQFISRGDGPVPLAGTDSPDVSASSLTPSPDVMEYGPRT